MTTATTAVTARRAGPALAAETWEALFRAQVALMQRFSADDIWSPVSMREYDVLFTLSRCPGRRLRLSELNKQVLMSQPSLSRMVDRLELRGLVSRAPAPGDRRGRSVSLTEAGAELQRAIGRRHAESIRHYLAPALDEAELRELRRLTEKLRSAQKDIADRAHDAGNIGEAADMDEEMRTGR